MNVKQNPINAARKAIEQGKLAIAAKILDPLIEGGDPAAMYWRAQFGFSGEDEDIFNARRISLLTRAEKLGHSDAAYELSIHFDSGDYVGQDIKKADRLLRRAAALGHPNAIWRIGTMILYGTGGELQNIQNGLELIEKAAALKSQGAVRMLGEFYSTGKFGYPRDERKAAQLAALAESDEVVAI